MEPRHYKHIRTYVSGRQTTVLKRQSTPHYTLIKENNEYFIECVKSGKRNSIGNKDQAEEIILYGIPKNYKL